MAYTSGRTVKSSRTCRSTAVATATLSARKLVKCHLGDLPGVTVDSSLTADPATLAPQVRTVITLPSGTYYNVLANAAESLPGVVKVTSQACNVTILRTI